jgi:hypothetical protein
MCSLSKQNIRACNVIDTACTKIGDQKVELLREYKAEFKMALACETGAQVGLFDEKKRRSIIS